MKKLLPLFALTALIVTALLPMAADAASYYPGYTCYYRDIAGSCLSYQQSNPYFTGRTYGTTNTRSLYGNRQTYPFHSMFNANATTQSRWDNRYPNYHNYNTNPYYRAYHYEEDDDDNNYVDEDDDNYRYYYGDNDEEEGWRMYYDEDDDEFRPYYYQNDNYYDDDDDNYYNYYDDDDSNNYYEYESTRIYCTGSDCDTYRNQY